MTTFQPAKNTNTPHRMLHSMDRKDWPARGQGGRRGQAGRAGRPTGRAGRSEGEHLGAPPGLGKLGLEGGDSNASAIMLTYDEAEDVIEKHNSSSATGACFECLHFTSEHPHDGSPAMWRKYDVCTGWLVCSADKGKQKRASTRQRCEDQAAATSRRRIKPGPHSTQKPAQPACSPRPGKGCDVDADQHQGCHCRPVV